jgi:CRP/FNR family transcriptional regulator, nitrogen oxide reductase regulator
MSTRRKSPLQIESVEPHACSVEMRLEILQQTPFFVHLSLPEITAVNKQFREYGYQPGETIYFSGDRATHLYVVASGQVKLLRHSESGQDALLDILQPGDYFGSLMAWGEEPYPDTAEAKTAVCILAITAESFRTLLQHYPGVALAVLDITTARLQESQEAVRRLSADSAERRIAAVLLKLAAKLGQTTAEGILIQTPLSRDDLAQMTGATAETASRIISQFQKDGLVRSGRQWIALTDKPGLEAIAGIDSAA